MKIVLFDTETTGFKENRMIQLAWKNIDTGEFVNEYFDPGVPIENGAMAVHHIRPCDIKDSSPFIESIFFKKFKELSEENILVAHNAQYDLGVLKNEEFPDPKFYICTRKVAYAYLLEEESYKLQTLRYSLGLDDNYLHTMMPHDALCDVITLERLFMHLFEVAKKELKTDDEKVILTEMVNISKRPMFIRKFAFGKYEGKYIQDIAKTDRGYLNWLFKKENIDEDLKYTLYQYLYPKTNVSKK